MGTAITTIDSVPTDAIKEIMLRLPTPAALVHAALASKSWRRVIADQHFLAEYRKLHASSPFLGLYVPKEFGGLPTFLMADSIRSASDGDLARAAARAFSLDGLESNSEWRLLDCYNGRLLLARGDEAVEVYSPLSRERISVRLPQGDFLPEGFFACLLQGHGNDAASFRVVSVQQRDGRRRMVRAIEYDSRTMTWTDHPWRTMDNIGKTRELEVMHAGCLIFCKYLDSLLLMLDTTNMEFSPLPLPCDNNPKNYAIGELEDGECCLVSAACVGLLNNTHLRVWKLKNLKWELDKDMRVKEVLRGYSNYPYYNVRAVTNGIALLCSSKRYLHFFIDLKTFRVKEKFEFKDLAAYPFLMPWPPTFSAAVAEEGDAGSQAIGGPICSGSQERDTLARVDYHKTKAVNYDGQHAECMLNTEDDFIPCNVDVVLLGCDSYNHAPGLRGEALWNCMPSNALQGLNIPESAQEEECYDNVPDQHLTSCNQNSLLMHPEATRIHHLAERKSWTSLGNGSQSAFVATNGLPYIIKNPEKRKYTWGGIEGFGKKQRCTLCQEDSDIES